MIYDVLLFVIPLLVIAAFIAALVYRGYLRHREKRTPGTIPPERFRSAKIALIVTSILLGTVAVFVLGVMGLMFMAVAFM